MLNSPRLGSCMVHRVGFRAWRFGRSLLSITITGWMVGGIWVPGALVLGAWCLWLGGFYLCLGYGSWVFLLIMDGTNTHPVDGWMNGWVHLGTYMTLVDLMT